MKTKYKIINDPYEIFKWRNKTLTPKELRFYKNKYSISLYASGLGYRFANGKALHKYPHKHIYDKRYKSNHRRRSTIFYPFIYKHIKV
jgi:adenine specific DNA methylase Mod